MHTPDSALLALLHESTATPAANDDAEIGSRWCYTVPWCESIQHAFNSLRWEVFHTRRYQGPRDARSVYALRREVGPAGTHSILDMQWVGDQPAAGTVAPLRRETLMRVFGSARPTRRDFDAVLERRGLPERALGRGTWLVLYERDRPREIVFYGRSGGIESPSQPRLSATT